MQHIFAIYPREPHADPRWEGARFYGEVDTFCHWAGLVQVLCSVDGRVHASVRDARKALT